MTEQRSGSAKTGMTTIGGQLIVSDRLAQFRRIYRWFNLTLVHQGVWPLLLLLTSAPPLKPGELPWSWFLARAGAPLAAILLALLYVRHQPQIDEGRYGITVSETEKRPALAMQVKVGILALTAMLIVARLVTGPVEPAARLILFGVADVLAFQIIHFEVVRRSFRDPTQGIGLAVLLFGLSWGLRDLLITALGPTEASPALALLTGAILGVLFGMLSRVLRSWPGGFWTAAAAQLIVVYLIIGFVD
jgi:putative solute:sodium symporter small subunit